MSNNSIPATNANSSGIELDRKSLKALTRRSDAHGLRYLLWWLVSLLLSGTLVSSTLGSLWQWPAMWLLGTFLVVSGYALSHETAHGTAFKTRWLNELVFYVTSFVYLEEPLHRRYTHTQHHTYTWHVDKDAQMPFSTPMGFWGWLEESSGLGLLRYVIPLHFRLIFKCYGKTTLRCVPQQELSKVTRNARCFMLGYLLLGVLAISGQHWVVWYLLIPRLLGGVSMALFSLIQHVEMQENSPSILHSTRSFTTNALGAHLYMNMNHHIEHHLYPQVPFHALPKLHQQLGEQLPKPDPGFWRTNAEVLEVVIKRSLKRHSKARTIRQAPHMIGEGGYKKIAHRTM